MSGLLSRSFISAFAENPKFNKGLNPSSPSTSLNETPVPSTGQPSTTTQFDGINVTLVNAASSTETGGGFQCTIGPVNDRA